MTSDTCCGKTRRRCHADETVFHRCGSSLWSPVDVSWRPLFVFPLLLSLLIACICIDAEHSHPDVERHSPTIRIPLLPPRKVGSESSDGKNDRQSSVLTRSKLLNPRRVTERKGNSINDVIASDTSRPLAAKTVPVVGLSNHSSSTTSGSHNEGRTRKLPDAIIIGVKKGGTRALLEFLKIHPDIRAPGPEIHFFDRHYDKGLEWYRSRMPPTLQGQLTIEKTPSYFVTRSAPLRVRRSMSSKVRLIVVVRDPVTRALSDYTQGLVKRPDLLPFESMAFGVAKPTTNTTSPSTPRHPVISSTSVNTSWGAIRIGLYARHLERWTRWFAPDRFHFVNGERLIDDPAGEISRLEDFLGVQRVVTADHFYFNVTKGFPCLKKSEARAAPRCLGQAKGRAHPVVDPSALDELRRFFRPYNRRFYQMTGVDFGWS